MRRLLRLSTMFASLLLATTMSAGAQEPIKIGVLLPFTGPLAKNGIENWEAMQIAREMINERGGVNGRKIEYLQGDATTPNAAISETERLITKEGIKITTGSFASPIAIAVSQAAERNGAFHWETTGAAEIITRRGFKYTFQVGAPARKYGQAAVDFVFDDLAKRLKKPVTDLKIALLWENRAFGKSVGDGIRAYSQTKGIKLAYDEGYDQTATDMTPIVQKLKDVTPDILIAISFPNDAILFQRKAKELDFNVNAFVGVSAGYSSPDLRDSIGDSVVGIFVADFPPKVNANVLKPEVKKVAEEFYKRYEAKLKRAPAGHAAAGFSAIWALFTEVLPKAKTFQPDELREIALKLDLPEGSLVNGSGIKFTNFDWADDPKDAGQNLRASIGVWQWTKAGNEEVYPPSLATSEAAMVPLPKWSNR
ncbi:ABC transporter substrate-binding protein [Tardiphaga sp. vice352]|uniref:ABC transporter substrate-binding protein n=1 Tax=unclassified Tardiphaga TaxID=2631404 RepID=UPI001161FC47|nr:MULTISPECIES: ABC transporter substrate-binding protein [unclassified Tardiphaga]QDM18044.1 ABC transporter substrate-binding protein [Tardiphaga sp. vice278]QDM23084.1 ABC transporter substrate-binding protein [Tardiphaga sp. vice154]QDM28249.1 ABC transporter substrate-binding protein [Tardiphaga sp. vice304]QDM33392.1 ABC transporter substrate-binding protein [Tardiphaga sp. vice352]